MPRKPELIGEILGLLVLMISIPLGLSAQIAPQSLSVDSLTASKNLISMSPPVYPVHAKQLHIQGSVALEVSVDISGRVTSVRALSGPPELQQGAIDAYSHARYRPFLRDGRPSPAVITMKINFEMNDEPLSDNDQVVARRYFELHEKCETLLDKKSSEATNVCLQAVGESKKLSPSVELESRAVAYSEAVRVLFNAGRSSEAEALGTEVVPLVAPAGLISQASATAYMTRAEVRLEMENSPGAIEDLDRAAEILKQLKANETSPVFLKMFQRERDQALHAKSGLLRQLGRSAEAKEADREVGR